MVLLMATTSGQLALEAVDAVAAAGLRFSVIHEEARLAEGSVSSDVDLVIDRPVGALVRTVAAAWVGRGLWPLIVWPYDVGGTGTVFLTTADAGDGVQLDMLFDPRGRGQYGAMSGEILARSEEGIRFPAVSPGAAAPYLLSKRLRKGQHDEAGVLIRSVGRDELARSVGQILTGPMEARVRAYLGGDDFRPRRVPTIGRLVGRLARPVGGWVTVAGDTSFHVASELADRFGRFLPRSEVVELAGFGSWLRGVAPVRWRAGVVFSAEVESLRVPKPDLRVAEGTDVADAARQVVSGMSRRHLHHLT